MLRAYVRTFDFKGRSSRREYWTFIAVFMAQAAAAFVVDGVFFDGLARLQREEVFGPAVWMIVVANFATGLSVQVRRLHDIDRSGWWFLVTLAPLIGTLLAFMYNLTPGTPGRNRFGREPGVVVVDEEALFS